MVGAITGADADAPARDTERYVTAGPRLSAADRFEIYRSGYHARLVECLLDDYPVLAAMLGEERFEALCRAYVDRHPSRSPNLNGFGRHMSSFCRESEALGARSAEGAEFGGAGGRKTAEGLPPVFASELAALEWALVEVLHAECAPPLDIARLQTLPPDDWARARFGASEALRIFRFEYPVNGVFIANRIEERVPEVPAPSPTALAVYRKDTMLWRMELSGAMLGVLEPLTLGKTLGEALAAIEADATDPAVLEQTGANLMVWFRDWVDAGFFTSITL
jgi:hypothetical protein